VKVMIGHRRALGDLSYRISLTVWLERNFTTFERASLNREDNQILEDLLYGM
jgi:hypothetical protein